MLHLQWSKRSDGAWWRLDEVELGQLEAFGVFVVWKNGDGARVSAVLYVGRGHLKDEVSRCRRDSIFKHGDLYITWAPVQDIRALDAIGAYLYLQLHPMWGEAVPSAPPLKVNLPLSA